jgi:hypothetical protein
VDTIQDIREVGVSTCTVQTCGESGRMGESSQADPVTEPTRLVVVRWPGGGAG